MRQHGRINSTSASMSKTSKPHISKLCAASDRSDVCGPSSASDTSSRCDTSSLSDSSSTKSSHEDNEVTSISSKYRLREQSLKRLSNGKSSKNPSHDSKSLSLIEPITSFKTKVSKRAPLKSSKPESIADPLLRYPKVAKVSSSASFDSELISDLAIVGKHELAVQEFVSLPEIPICTISEICSTTRLVNTTNFDGSRLNPIEEASIVLNPPNKSLDVPTKDHNISSALVKSINGAQEHNNVIGILQDVKEELPELNINSSYASAKNTHLSDLSQFSGSCMISSSNSSQSNEDFKTSCMSPESTLQSDIFSCHLDSVTHLQSENFKKVSSSLENDIVKSGHVNSYIEDASKESSRSISCCFSGPAKTGDVLSGSKIGYCRDSFKLQIDPDPFPLNGNMCDNEPLFWPLTPKSYWKADGAFDGLQSPMHYKVGVQKYGGNDSSDVQSCLPSLHVSSLPLNSKSIHDTRATSLENISDSTILSQINLSHPNKHSKHSDRNIPPYPNKMSKLNKSSRQAAVARNSEKAICNSSASPIMKKGSMSVSHMSGKNRTTHPEMESHKDAIVQIVPPKQSQFGIPILSVNAVSSKRKMPYTFQEQLAGQNMNACRIDDKCTRSTNITCTVEDGDFDPVIDTINISSVEGSYNPCIVSECSVSSESSIEMIVGLDEFDGHEGFSRIQSDPNIFQIESIQNGVPFLEVNYTSPHSNTSQIGKLSRDCISIPSGSTSVNSYSLSRTDEHKKAELKYETEVHEYVKKTITAESTSNADTAASTNSVWKSDSTPGDLFHVISQRIKSRQNLFDNDLIKLEKIPSWFGNAIHAVKMATWLYHRKAFLSDSSYVDQFCSKPLNTESSIVLKVNRCIPTDDCLFLECKPCWEGCNRICKEAGRSYNFDSLIENYFYLRSQCRLHEEKEVILKGISAGEVNTKVFIPLPNLKSLKSAFLSSCYEVKSSSNIKLSTGFPLNCSKITDCPQNHKIETSKDIYNSLRFNPFITKLVHYMPQKISSCVSHGSFMLERQLFKSDSGFDISNGTAAKVWQHGENNEGIRRLDGMVTYSGIDSDKLFNALCFKGSQLHKASDFKDYQDHMKQKGNKNTRKSADCKDHNLSHDESSPSARYKPKLPFQELQETMDCQQVAPDIRLYDYTDLDFATTTIASSLSTSCETPRTDGYRCPVVQTSYCIDSNSTEMKLKTLETELVEVKEQNKKLEKMLKNMLVKTKALELGMHGRRRYRNNKKI